MAGYPALIARSDEDMLVIADLHIGLGNELEKKGILIAGQTEKMIEDLSKLSSHSDHLIIVGDLRHEIIARNVVSEIPAFMSSLLDIYHRIDIIPGNHDGMIVRMMPQRIRVHPPAGFSLAGFSFFHGHTWPLRSMMNEGTLIMGHIHPAVEFIDSLDNRYVEKCWFRAPMRRKDPTKRYDKLPEEVIILPAFNPLLTGTPINKPGSKVLGPLFSNGLVRTGKGKLYLLDGTFLGTLSENLKKTPTAA
ncbi:MAG: metallophosphoesterase [Thermoplasmata archaeon]|nr:metallophosphoesterase [Candidatus Sysuiplasma acidicola]